VTGMKVYEIVLAEGGIENKFLLAAESSEEAITLAKQRSLVAYIGDAEIVSAVELGWLWEHRE
jgi:hypothetical protein